MSTPITDTDRIQATLFRELELPDPWRSHFFKSRERILHETFKVSAKCLIPLPLVNQVTSN